MLSSLPDRNSVRGKREGELSGTASRTGGLHEARPSSSLRATGERRGVPQERRAEQTGAHFSPSPPNELEGRATFTAPVLLAMPPNVPFAVPSNTVSLGERGMLRPR